MTAPSIADLFYNNCFKNGILPITLDEVDVRQLLLLASNPAMARIQIDLAAQTVTSLEGPAISFQVDARRKQDLLEGIDEIGRTIGQEPRIAAFEAWQRSERGWIAEITGGKLGALSLER